MKRFVPILLVLSCMSASFPIQASAETGSVWASFARTSEVLIWRADFGSKDRLQTFEPGHLQGAFLASGDVNGDGRDELVLGAGPGRSSDVIIYTADGKELSRFRAYATWFKGGVRVAVADTDGDGIDEIITAPGPGMEPLIHIFDYKGNHKLSEKKPAYHPAFQGGVHVAAADLNGDGKAEIVTTPGPGGGPHVRIFDGQMENTGQDFFAFDELQRDGITVAIARTPSGPQIVIGVESWSMPIVKLFSVSSGLELKKEFLAYDQENWRSGVTVAAFDKDGDGYDEIATGPNGGSNAEVRVFDIFGSFIGKYLLHDPNYRGGLSLAQVDWHGDGWPELATVALAPVVNGPLDKEKHIEVNLAEQRLYAYEHGRLARSFYISSGVYKYPTPELVTSVLEKIPVKDYRWSYGVNHPDNYDLPNVQFNLRIFGPYYIHYAYWHNNFGHRMSHGCINVNKENAEWIYNWADVGTSVETHY